MLPKTKLVPYSQSLGYLITIGLRNCSNSVVVRALEDYESFGSFNELLIRLRSISTENSAQPDFLKVHRIIRLCADDPSFYTRPEAPNIAVALLDIAGSREQSHDILLMMISKILTGSSILTKDHLVLYKRCRNIASVQKILPDLTTRLRDLPTNFADWAPNEVALWLDILTYSQQYQTKSHSLLSDRAIDMVTGLLTPVDPKTVSMLLRSLSYCRGISHEISSRAVIGAFKQIIPQFDSFNHIHALTIVRSIRRMFPNRDWARDSKISEFVDLCFVEIFRNFHLLKPHDLVDCLIISPTDKRLRDSVISLLPELTPRQVSLVLWSGKKFDDKDILAKILDHLNSIDISSPRDWALILHSVSNRSSDIDIGNLLDKFLDQKIRCKNLQEYSMILAAAIRIAGPRDGRVYDLVRYLPDILSSTPRSSFSIQSILSTIHSICQVRKSSPLIQDLGRVLYARVSSMTPNQAAFAFSLLRSDETISQSFIPFIYPRKITNHNLVNLVAALSVEYNEKHNLFIDEVYERAKKLNPDQYVACLESVVKMEDRLGRLESSEFLYRLHSTETLVSFSPRALVEIFVIMETLLRPKITQIFYDKIRETICLGLIEKLKSSSHSKWEGPELILMAKELVRLGRSGLKPNLRDRFLVKLMIGIKTRAIPTKLLLENLKPIDTLGTFHQLPIYLQEHLYKKATREQREGVRRPKSIRSSVMDKTKIRESASGSLYQVTSQIDQPVSHDEERIEIEQMEQGTAVSHFIQKIRKHNNS